MDTPLLPHFADCMRMERRAEVANGGQPPISGGIAVGISLAAPSSPVAILFGMDVLIDQATALGSTQLRRLDTAPPPRNNVTL